MAGIFLSYSREDKHCAEALARILEQAGHEVWWDRHIGTGREFSAEIEAALEKVDIVLVAWSKNASKSPWVRDEAAIGRDSGRLLPVIIDGGQPPIGFRQFQALDLSGWKGRGKDPRTKELIDAVDSKLSGKSAQFGRTKRRFGSLGRPTVWGAVAVLLLVIGGVVALFLYTNRDPQGGPLSKPTIALLPFTTPSADAELRQLGSQARDSLAHIFSQSGLPLRPMGSAPQDGRSGVDFWISGDLSRNGDKIVATVRLDEAAHRVTVFSHRLEASGEDARNLPERIGAQMAGSLTWSGPLMMLDRRRPIDPTLLADLLQGAAFTGDPLQRYQNVKRVAAKAPDLRVAQVALAFDTSFALDQIPREERLEAVVAARRAADRAMKLGPDNGDAYGTWCLLHSATRMVECEDRLRAGKRVDPDAPFLNTFLSNLLRSVGRFDESMERTRLSHTHDLYVPTKIGFMLRMHEYAGESGEARDLYQQGVRWWPEFQPFFFRNRFWGLVDRGDFEAILRLEQEMGAKNLPPNYRGSSALVAALRSRSVVAAKRACTPVTENFLLNVRCMLALASLGDQDGAYAIADKEIPSQVGRTPAETERIWLDNPSGSGAPEFFTSPAAAPLRRDPRYVTVAQRIGLLAYWRSGRPPDFCRKDPEPICAQLLKRR
jgi:hypothetical protein